MQYYSNIVRFFKFSHSGECTGIFWLFLFISSHYNVELKKSSPFGTASGFQPTLTFAGKARGGGLRGGMQRVAWL